MLTPREYQIAFRILSANAGLRIKDLAAEFQVSTRSVQYSLDNVKDFFKKRNIKYCSSSSKGIWAEGSEDDRDNALEELSQMQADGLYFDQDMRVRRIYLELIYSGEYVTAGTFAEKLKVSRSTILSDMNHGEMLLQDSGLTLRRRAHWGYRLDGPELALRTLAENSFQEEISVYDVYMIINGLKSDMADLSFLPLPEEAMADCLIAGRELVRAFQEKAAEMQKENVITLMIRLLISLSRVRKGHIVGDTEKATDLSGCFLYPYWAAAYEACGLPVLKDELDYIQGRYQEKKYPVDIVDLSMKLVENVSKLENYPYYEDNSLYSRLLIHLRHCFSSGNKGMAKNPFQDLVMSNHGHLYNSVQTVCKEHIDNVYLLANESFVSYLVMYFLVARQNLELGQKWKAVFVCATGHGGAKIVARMLESQLKQIEVVQHCSLTEVDEVVQKTKPDFIISVFPLKAAVPVIVVEPIPTKADICAIQRIIDKKVGENQLLTEGTTTGFWKYSENPEDISQEVILIGLKIYEKLIDKESWNIKPGLEFAFLTHVMLLANRYVFDNQYSHQTDSESVLDKDIINRLAEIGIVLNIDEIKALTYYLITE